MSAALPRQGQRDLARVFFVGCLVFGMADGVLNHDWSVDPAKPSQWNLSLVPLWQGLLNRGGLVVSVQQDLH